MDLPVNLVYDGYEREEHDTAFIEVRQMPNNNEVLSKRKESVRTTFRFQISIYANSEYDRMVKQEEVNRLLLFEDVRLVDGITGFVGGLLDVDIPFITPINAEELNDKSSYFRTHLDVEVRGITGKNK